MHTVRKYPRSLAEAFKGPSYAAAIERPWPPLWKRLLQSIKEILT